MPLPRPAPCSTSPSCPAPVKARTALGTVATRYSSDLISRGMPTRIRYTPCGDNHGYCVGLMTPASLAGIIAVRSTLLEQLFALFLKGGDDFFVVPDDADICTLGNWCIGGGVYRYDSF